MRHRLLANNIMNGATDFLSYIEIYCRQDIIGSVIVTIPVESTFTTACLLKRDEHVLTPLFTT